jgi:chemotaxis protein histidine kinase CheA
LSETDAQDRGIERPSGDLDLDLLLAGEIERRLMLLEGPSPASSDVRAALHTLRGSASLAGHSELSIVIGQLSARIREGDEHALSDAVALLRASLARLQRGRPPFETRWPEPPPGLGPSPIDARYRSEYHAALRERLGELDAVLGVSGDPREALERAYRSVHAMKGAAASVGDDTTAWYCHGLETRLKALLRTDPPPSTHERADAQHDALADLGRHRAILTQLLEEPIRALETLRALSAPPSAPPPAASLRPSGAPPASRPPSPEEEEKQELFVRISAPAVDRFLERLERIDLVHDELMGAAEIARQAGVRMRNLRATLLEALRLIGPPRPWGPPAAALANIEAAARALHTVAGSAERGAALCRRNAELLHVQAGEMRADAAALRRTSLRWLFDRVRHAAERLAEREGKLVRVESSGEGLLVDRRIAERLLDPVLQLTRNAVAHGIEPPELRGRAGKPEAGTIVLRAERLGDWLRLVVDDDGRGVNVDRIRALAVERGIVTREAAAGAHDDELLALLFVPGLTTHESADFLAGRGVGLDLAQDTVRRLGGAIRLGSRLGHGLTATVEVPSERGLIEVVWLEIGSTEFALPVTYCGRVERADEARRLVPLSTCLGLSHQRRPTLALELVIHGVQSIAVGIDGIGEIEEVSVRAIPPLVAAAGPYAGAVLRSDGSLRLALDAALVAARAWARVG